MIAREKCTWFGYVLAASFLSSLWPDVATSPSPIRRGWDNLPRRAHPPPPRKTGEDHAAAGASQLQTHAARHARTFLRARRACANERGQRI